MDYDPFGLFAQILCRPVNLKDVSAVTRAIVSGLVAPVHCRLRVSCCSPSYDVTIGLEAKGKDTAGNGIYKITTEGVQKGWSAYPVWGYSNGRECFFENCVQQKAKNYNPYPYSLFGPNSNTFVRRMIEECGGQGAFPSNAIGSTSD